MNTISEQTKKEITEFLTKTALPRMMEDENKLHEKYTIKAAREQAGFTLEDMAHYLHLEPEKYAQFESYEIAITAEQLYHFRNLVKIPLADILITRTNEKSPGAGNTETLIKL